MTVNVASGGGGGAGFKVTFPATATDWSAVDPNAALILLSDGTFKTVENYSIISGQTIENVAGIQIKTRDDFFVLRMTLSEGRIAQFACSSIDPFESLCITTAPNTTPTPYRSGRSLAWWPLADTVISAIDIYNTD